jgi:hypothetical protein
MPYHGHERLVFRSASGDVDTIFLLEKDTVIAYPEAQSLRGSTYQTLTIYCKHSDQNRKMDSNAIRKSIH